MALIDISLMVSTQREKFSVIVVFANSVENMDYLLSKMRKKLKLLNLLLMIIITNSRKELDLWKRL